MPEISIPALWASPDVETARDTEGLWDVGECFLASARLVPLAARETAEEHESD
jgi:hypothetical protein